MMLVKSVASPFVTTTSHATAADFGTSGRRRSSLLANINFLNCPPLASTYGRRSSTSFSEVRQWELRSTTQIDHDAIFSDEDDKRAWDSCRQSLAAFGFSDKEENNIIGKAFGQIHSPYWGEERKKEIPKLEVVNEILDYLRSLSLGDDDLRKLLKKFPEVLGCSLEDELKNNVKVLEKDWGIKGKSLKNLLLRNPKVLGYNIDCKGDCMAQCTRCWVRF